MPGSSGLVVAGDDVRLLVPVQPDAVAGAVDEALAVAGGGRSASRAGGVDRRGGDAGPDRRDARRLGVAAAPRSRRGTRPAAAPTAVRAGRSPSSSRRHGAADVDDDRARRRRSPGRRCRGAGWRRSGRRATMTKSTVACPSARIAAAMSAATSRSVRPARSHSPHPRVHRRRWPAPARRSAVDLGGGLAHPQLAQHLAGEALLGAGQRGAQGEHLLGPHAVAEADRRGPRAPRAAATRAYGSVPSAWSTMTGTPRGRRPRRRAFQPGHDEGRLARRRAAPGRSAAPAAWAS